MMPTRLARRGRGVAALVAIVVVSGCSVASPSYPTPTTTPPRPSPAGSPLLPSTRPTPEPATAASPSEPAPAPTSAIVSIAETGHTLEPGESREIPISLEGATEGHLLLFGERPDDLLATVDGRDFERVPEPFAMLGATLRGQTQATVVVTNMGTRPMGIVLSVQALTTRVLTVTLDSSVLAGEAVDIEVTLTEASPADRPLLTMRSEDAVETPIELTPVGIGRWRAVVEPRPGQTHRIQAAVAGPRPRTAGSFVTVGQAGVAILPGFRERIVPGPDGLASDLILSVTIVSEQSIEGSLAATLVDPAGREVARSHQRLTLEAGRHEYDLSFDGSEIGRRRVPGPYRLVDVRVLSTGLTVTAELKDAGTTEASDPAAFAHLPVLFDLDAFTERTIDADRDGRFEAIVVTGRVHLDEAGRYSVQGELFAGQVRIADHFTADDLTAGWNDIEIRFDGGAIRAKSVNGPYQVRNVSVTGNGRDDPDATGFVSSAMSTGRYAASSFED